MKRIKKALFYIIMFLSFLLPGKDGFAQQISPFLFGQNAWMPDSVGNKVLNGKLHQTWGTIKESGAGSIRFGGIAPDRDKPSNYQYLKMIDSIRTRGMEPVIQVSYWNGMYSAGEAAELVKFINITNNRGIKYWSIGNEPDHSSTYGITNSSEVAPYIKSFSSAMKAVDPGIKIIGPDCAWYNEKILYGLTTPGSPDDITGKNPEGNYYVDIISFHEYPFNGGQTRDEVISNITAEGGFESKLIDLKSRLSHCNEVHGRAGSAILKMAVTEANINYINNDKDNLYGNGATSFIGGQYWAEMLSVAMKHEVEFMNFWSVIEGNNTALNIGYLDRTSLSKQPSFYHFKLLADNFSGTYCSGSSNQKDIKTFGSKNENRVSVIILNQNTSEKYNYTVRLNNSSVSGTDPVKLNINASLDKEYHDVISGQSTTLLVFNASGDLIRKCEYKLNGHADKGLAPHCLDLDEPLSVKINTSSLLLCKDDSLVLHSTENKGNFYQWNKNGEPVPDAIFPGYTVFTEGLYSVTIKNGSFSATSESLKITGSDIPSATISHDGNLNVCESNGVKLSANRGTEYEYSWRKDDQEMLLSDSPDFIATTPGNYTVNIRNSCGNAVSAPVTISGCEAVVKDILTGQDKSGGIHVYPNPSNHYFTVEMQADKTGNADMTVYLEIINATGQVVHKQTLSHQSGHIKQMVELDPSYPNGMYIVRLRVGAKTFTHKITVSR